MPSTFKLLVFVSAIFVLGACVTEQESTSSHELFEHDHSGGRRPRSIGKPTYVAPAWDKDVLKAKIPKGTTSIATTCWKPAPDLSVRKTYYPLNYPVAKVMPSNRVYYVASDLCAKYGKDFLDKEVQDSKITSLYVSYESKLSQEVIVGFETANGLIFSSAWATDAHGMHGEIQKLKTLNEADGTDSQKGH